MMRPASANCYWCGGPFKYIKVTKPRRYCSNECADRRDQHLQNVRRRLKRRRLAQSRPLNQ